MSAHLPSAGSRKVEPRKRKRTPSDKRRKSERLIQRIQKTATERQAAWSEGDQPNITFALTGELDDLFCDSREQSAGEMAPGHPTTSGMYRP